MMKDPTSKQSYVSVRVKAAKNGGRLAFVSLGGEEQLIGVACAAPGDDEESSSASLTVHPYIYAPLS